MSEDRAFVEGYAAAKNLRVKWDGEIGFGRECVGLLDPDRRSYVAYSWDSPCGPPPEAPDAYHKDNYIAVLGSGPDTEAQLAAWVRRLAEVGATFEYRGKDVPDLGSLLWGHSDELTASAVGAPAGERSPE